MIINKRDLEVLHTLKIKHDNDEFPLPSLYLYIDNKKSIFINKFRNKLYLVLASNNTGLSQIDSQTVYNVLFSSNDLNEVIKYWKRCIKEIM